MFKKILSLLAQDTVRGLRDNLLLFMIASPIALAAIVALSIPQSAVPVPVLVDRAVGDSFPSLISADEDIVLLRVSDDPKAALSQGEASFALTRGRSGPVLLTRDDADASILPLVREALGNALGIPSHDDSPSGEPVRADAADSPETGTLSTPSAGSDQLKADATLATIRDYAAVMLVMLALLIGGVMSGFAIVEERENLIYRAMAVSPLSPADAYLARGIFSLIAGGIVALANALILTGDLGMLGGIAAVLPAALPCSILIGFLLGSLSATQVAAMSVLKILMLAFLTLPFLTIFLPEEIKPVFWLFPNFWLFELLRETITGTSSYGYWLSWCATLGAGTVWIILWSPLFSRKLKFR